MKHKYYHVSYAYIKNKEKGFAQSTFEFNKKIRRISEIEYICDFFKEKYCLDEVVILNWNRLKG